MKPDDPKFTELALRVIAGKANAAEQASLKALLQQPELAAEYKQLQADTSFGKEVLPLLGEEPVTVPPLTDFELSQMRRLAEARQKKLRTPEKKAAWSWRWLWVLAPAAAVIVIAVALNLPPSHHTIQLAMLDSMGTTRGTNDINATLLPALKESFGRTNLNNYTESEQLNNWLSVWPDAKTVKVVYDRDNGLVRVVYRDTSNQIISKAFPVLKESDLPAVLKKAAEALGKQ
jgi:hypothetical protein